MDSHKQWNNVQRQTQESKGTNYLQKSSWILYERRNGTKYTRGNYPVYEKFCIQKKTNC